MNNLAEQDITVKKISTDIVYRLDQQASARGESRNQYIKEILEDVCVNPKEAASLDREEKMFENVAIAIKAFITKFHELEEIIEGNLNDMNSVSVTANAIMEMLNEMCIRAGYHDVPEYHGDTYKSAQAKAKEDMKRG